MQKTSPAVPTQFSSGNLHCFGTLVHRTRFLKQQEALLFSMSTSGVPVLSVKHSGCWYWCKYCKVYFQPANYINTEGKEWLVYRQSRRTPTWSMTSSEYQGRVCLEVPDVNQRKSFTFRIQERESLAKTLYEFRQSISTKHLLFSLSQRLRKFFNYLEVLLLNSLIYTSEGAEWLQRLL